MAILSTLRHRERYSPPSTLPEQLAEIKLLLDAIRKLDISPALQKRMLVHTLWQVAIVTGNTQSSFIGQFRSEGVLRERGLKIERDHIYRKENLVRQLLEPSPDLDLIVSRAHCCVVTKDEHDRLGRIDGQIDGWNRYRAAGIIVYDMARVPAEAITEFPERAQAQAANS